MKETIAGIGVTGTRTRASLAPPFEYREKGYLLRFARTDEDLDQVFALRYEVFNVELGEGLESSHAARRDRDVYDDQCQHLMVVDTETERCIGTYRLQIAEAAEAGVGFYSASEFDLGSLPREILDGMVELGRACVVLDHRKRSVLNMLWRGMAAYLLHHGKRYFFGCSSLTSQDPAVGAATWDHLQARGYAHPSVYVPPLPSYVCEGEGGLPAPIPTLFTLYLRCGARVCGPPALDRFFGTIDFLTLLDTQSMDQAIFRNYVD